jgi:hypothetical protein
MFDNQADDVKDVHGDEYGTSGPRLEEAPMVICPRCQALNSPDRVACSQCRAKLLPGRGILERIGYVIAGIVGAALFVGLGWLFARMETAETLPPCCASPAYLWFMALCLLIGGIVYALGRTPEYEKYVKRAQRHVEAGPEQALADLTKALELAPEKEQADILRQRGELYSKLGHKEEALADLSAYSASPHAHKGAKFASKVIGVELEEGASALFTEGTIGALQKELMREGALTAVGYCKRCKDAVELDENRLCSRCSGKVKEARFVKPEESEGELAKLRKEAAARRKRRLIGLSLGGLALFACALCVGMGVWSSQMRKEREGATATAVMTTAPTTFTETVLSLEHPSSTPPPTLTPTSLPTSTPPPTPTPTSLPTPTPQPDGVVNVEALNLRAGPGTAYDKEGLLRQGDELDVVARTAAGDWLTVIAPDGSEGWVSAVYVDLNISADNIPVATKVPPTPTPSGPTPTPLSAVDAEIERIAQDEHGELSQPSEVGHVAAGGEAEVSIVNDTPYELTILVGVPNSTSITIEACPACKVYGMVGPIFCPQEGRPKKTVRLKPGTCQVAAKVSDPSVIPFLGAWELKSDTSYFNCFYIVSKWQ